MKKILLAFLLLLSIAGFTQETGYYRAFKTQLFKSYPSQSNWIPVNDPTDVDILITMRNSHMIINAQTPTSFTIYNSTGEDVNGSGYYGRRFRAVEHSKDRDCFVSIINYVNADYVTIQVTYLNDYPQFLLIYYIEKK